MKVLLKRFHLNGNTTGFHPQTQLLWVTDSLVITWFRRETINPVSAVATCFVKCFFCRFQCSCSNWRCSCRFESTHQSTGYFTDILLNCPAEYQRYLIVTYYRQKNRRYFFAFFGRAIAQSGRGAPSLIACVSRPRSLRACLPSKNAKNNACSAGVCY